MPSLLNCKYISGILFAGATHLPLKPTLLFGWHSDTSNLSHRYMDTHIHICLHIHSCTQKHIHARASTYTCICIHKLTYTHTHMQTWLQVFFWRDVIAIMFFVFLSWGSSTSKVNEHKYFPESRTLTNLKTPAISHNFGTESLLNWKGKREKEREKEREKNERELERAREIKILNMKMGKVQNYLFLGLLKYI